jgi:hypothetical protein
MVRKPSPLIDPETAELFRVKERQYLRSVRTQGHFQCPQCRADLDDAGQYSSFDLEGSTIYQSVSCGHCGAEWRDAYELDRVVGFTAGQAAGHGPHNPH